MENLNIAIRIQFANCGENFLSFLLMFLLATGYKVEESRVLDVLL